MIRLAEPGWLMWLWIAPAVAALAAWAIWRRRSLLRRFADLPLLRRHLATVRWPIRMLRAGAAVTALLVLPFALARPQANPREVTVTRTGRDIAIVVDVSKSMLADDLAPTRLDRAKLWIRDLVSSLQGDRIALVAFAGNAVVKSPLTLDYEFFDLALEELSPSSVARGGTLIGDAIRKTLSEVFEDDSRHKDIILITDGEDHESFPIQAAGLAREANVRIIAIGLGSTEGAKVSFTDDRGRQTTVTENGRPIVSRMDAGTLQSVAAASAQGVFLNVGTGNIDLERVYADLIRSAGTSETGTITLTTYEEFFQPFLLIAFALLCMELLLNERRGGLRA